MCVCVCVCERERARERERERESSQSHQSSPLKTSKATVLIRTFKFLMNLSEVGGHQIEINLLLLLERVLH